MIYPIVKFGNPVLETKAADVTEFGDEGPLDGGFAASYTMEQIQAGNGQG